MIRFVDLGEQILDGTREFTFYDTVTEEFIVINGSCKWDSWDDFYANWMEDIVDGDVNTTYYNYLKRFHTLCPGWVFNNKLEG